MIICQPDNSSSDTVVHFMFMKVIVAQFIIAEEAGTIFGKEYLSKEVIKMATNGKSGDNRRHGAVKGRSQTVHSNGKLYVKRDADSGKFMDVKTSGGKFKGVRKEK